ncbi:MAG TPA: GMC family oxidoreductase [Longimicrobiales bacterium]|nr:GMC family oxidoreductase [Longimicrobiales bacterium]
MAYDVLIIGSGPGGASVARELARAGRRVLILERGRDWRTHRLYGTYPGALLYADRHALLFTRQGLNVIRPIMVGGATSMYAACASRPGDWWLNDYGIDLTADADAIMRELQIAPLPPELRGVASTRLAEAGSSLGMEWAPQDKFMLPARGDAFRCGAHCMLGCRCGAKWNAAEWIDDAMAAGAVLQTGTHVTALDVEGGAVRRIRGSRNGRPWQAEAHTVVVAAGGLGTPLLLRTAGLDEAGRGMAMDTTVMVYGALPNAQERVPPQGDDPPMTWSSTDDELGVMYSTLIDPWLMYPIIMAVKGARWPLTWPRWKRTLGVMIKLTDELSGEIDARGGIDKGLTETDRVRLERAQDVARNILRRAGCEEHSLVTTPLRGTHPSATARIGSVVDDHLATEVRGLYVCDASVFPRALGRPTVLTILALGRRLARELAAGHAARHASSVEP